MDPKDRIPHDDWADQDLLTRDEAAERLEAEIADLGKKAEAGQGDEIQQRRLDAMKEALARMRES